MCPSYKRESERGQTFAFTSTKLWNSIPIVIKQKESVESFKKTLTQFFFEQYSKLDNFELLI